MSVGVCEVSFNGHPELKRALKTQGYADLVVEPVSPEKRHWISMDEATEQLRGWAEEMEDLSKRAARATGAWSSEVAAYWEEVFRGK